MLRYDPIARRFITVFADIANQAIIESDKEVELIANSNTNAGEDGNYRLKMVNDKLQTQRLILSVWTPLEEI